MKLEKVKISQLKPHPKNPKLHADDKIAESIKEFGYTEPIIVDENNQILAGHGRLKALKKLGITETEVIRKTGLTEKQKEKYILMSNKLVELGGWNFDLLKNFDENLLKDVGFSDFELDDIFKVESSPQDDEIPEVKKTDIKQGDLFQLGNHRLLCGDATSESDVAKLMQGEKADMVFTDPPYGVNYGAKNRFLNSFQKAGKNLKDISNDTIGKNELFDMLVKAFTLANKFGQNYCSYYVTAPQRGELALMMMMMMMMSGLPVKHILIWVKNKPNFSLGRLDYEYQHEPILFTWKKKHKFYGNGIKTSIWNINKELKCDLHPTMKPVALIENALLNSSKRNDIILDLFLGSGSTLIACEKLNRRCYGMEIDPLYVQVTIDRWEKFTGKKSIKLK